VTIDEFGLGDWWPRPDQAAAGPLDHLPADQWPMLAAKWLARSLREDAKRPGSAHIEMNLPAISDEIATLGAWRHEQLGVLGGRAPAEQDQPAADRAKMR
jgi:hypothetical protein